MSHEIENNSITGRAEIAYAGAEPWHGLGQRLSPDADIDVWAEQAGLNWEVKRATLRFQNEEGEAFSDKSRTVLYRSDDNYVLGTCCPDYQIVQPRQILEFFRDFAFQAGFKLEVAGCIGHGKKVWALARAGENAKLCNGDFVAPYVVMATSADQTLATVIDPTFVRVVCANTLRMAIGDGTKAKVRVNHRSEYNAEACAAQMGFIPELWHTELENIERLTQFRIDRDEAIDLVADELKQLYKIPFLDKEGNELQKEGKLSANIKLRKIFSLYDGDGMIGNDALDHGTGWRLLNAVTEATDHHFGRDRSASFDRAQFKDAAVLKVNVASRLTAMATA